MGSSPSRGSRLIPSTEPSTARAGGALARLGLALAAALLALGVLAATASAEITEIPGFNGSGASPALAYGESSKVAVDEASGDVYVLDATNAVVDRFSSTGTYKSHIAVSGPFTGNGLDDIAVDNSGGSRQGYLYVMARSGEKVWSFDASGSLQWEVPPPSTGVKNCGIAVDANGNPWIAYRSKTELEELNPANGSAAGPTIALNSTDLCHFAFDAEGSVYIASKEGGFEKYPAGGGSSVEFEPAPDETWAVASNWSGGGVFSTVIDHGISAPVIRQWDKNGTELATVQGTGGTNDYRGIAFDASRSRLYVSDIGFSSNTIRIFAVGTPLTVEKLPTGTGEGTVVSNPAGIECGPACEKETATFEEGALVTLTANPAAGSVFTSWTGCTKTIEGTGAKGHTCTVQMTKALTVKAKFTAVQAITAKKDSAGNGFGTVSSSPGGIACGPTCTQATALFTEGSTVTLKAVAVTSTSQFAGWSVCEGTEEGNLCKVVASAAKSATAKFNLIPQFALTLSKSGGGTGTVSSSPAGISCGPTCSGAVAAYNTNKEVTLKAVAATGSTFGGWSGACSGTGECKVTMSAAKSVGAEFK
jgi:hypothetical protein